MDIIHSFQLNITCFEPTRIFTNIKGVTSTSTIDFMITIFPLATYDCCVIGPYLGDHKGHILLVKLESRCNDKRVIPDIKIRDFSFSNLNNLSSYLANFE